MNANQIDKKVLNNIKIKNFKFDNVTLNYQSVAIYYIALEAFYKDFDQVVQKKRSYIKIIILIYL